MKTDQDLSFMNELPHGVQSDLMIDYLFSDFLKKYESYFVPPNANDNRQ